MNNTGTSSGAELSESGIYRYRLWRNWDHHLPNILFVMLNPSTADANEDDPTIRRCISFARSWGYGGLYVGNLFAYRSKDPRALTNIVEPVGPENDDHLRAMARACERLICAWGNAPILRKLNYVPSLGFLDLPTFCIDRAKDGTPKHPLYLRGDLQPQRI